MISTKAQSFLCSGLNALDQLAMALGSQFIFCRKVLFLHSGKKKKKKCCKHSCSLYKLMLFQNEAYFVDAFMV